MTSTETPSCRICFLSEEEANERLISPCKCNGTCRYIHPSCLRECRKIGPIKNYMTCGLCQTNYKIKVTIKIITLFTRLLECIGFQLGLSLLTWTWLIYAYKPFIYENLFTTNIFTMMLQKFFDLVLLMIVRGLCMTTSFMIGLYIKRFDDVIESR